MSPPTVVVMTTWAISIQIPEGGPLEEQTDALLNSVRPFMDSLTRQPAGRAGNVLAYDLLSSTGIRQTNRYLLLVDADRPSPRSLRRLTNDLTAVLPAGAIVSALGEFDSVARSPESQLLAW